VDRTYPIIKNATIRIDGQNAKLTDLKAGMHVREAVYSSYRKALVELNASSR
jgi:hypothetical protein